MRINRPSRLAAVAATVSAACVVAMAGTAFAADPRRPSGPAATTAPALVAPSRTVATTPAFAPG